MEATGRVNSDNPNHVAPAYAAEVRKVTLVGLVLNVFLAAFKFIAGTVGSSQAIVADAVHSLSDMTTDAAILVGVRYWSAPPDDNHPHGHQRIETLITVLIGALLAVVAVGLVIRALGTLEVGDGSGPGWIAFFAAMVSIVSKEWIYRWTAARGKAVRSPSVVANAWHHRSDALSSIPAAVAVLGARVHPSWVFLDQLGAVVVSVFIFQAAGRIALPALGQLTDAGAPRKVRERISSIARQTDGVEQVHAVRTRYVGSSLQVDLHVQVDGNLSVREGHDISGAVKYNLLEQGPDVIDVVVHLEPFDSRKTLD